MHTHYTLEEASNPPKERGRYHCKLYSTELILNYNHETGIWFNEHGKECHNANLLWLRPVTEEERAKEMGEFGEWTQLNDWIYSSTENLWFYRSDGDPRTGKTTDELTALFTHEREKQKQQKGENNNG